MGKSSFNGIIHDIPDIFVDNFEDKSKKAYFLSHYHADHTVGLEDEYFPRILEETGAKIYMTESSMRIVEYWSKNPEICKFIQPLKLGTTTVTIGDDLHIEVTLIPAGHSIGSVMFLFQTTNKTILYTGDFRMHSNDLVKYAQFHKNGEPIHIDVMYVDTTFIGVVHPVFPKRSDSVEEMLYKIDSWLKKAPENRVAIHTSGNYTCEFSFREIYKKLGVKVDVSEHLWRIYKQFPEVRPAVTYGEDDPLIHLCRNIRYRRYCGHNQKRWNRYQSFHLSATQWTDFETDQATSKDGYSDTIDVCFATHCSRSELIYFVNYLSPTVVYGFPNEYNPDTYTPVKHVNNFVPTPRKPRKLNLEEEQGKKVDSQLLKEMFRE